MRCLLIETSTERGLISLIENGEVLFSTELPFGYNQSKNVMPEITALSQKYALTENRVDSIAVGIGPGSYTGIRIGVVIAKALAYAWQIPIIPFSSLQAFIPEKNSPFIALIDAKIGGVYILKGEKKDEMVKYISDPFVCPLEDLTDKIAEIDEIISPSIVTIKKKIDQLYPSNKWIWQEAAPSAPHLAKIVDAKYKAREWITNGHIDILYLRKTQAELEKDKGT